MMNAAANVKTFKTKIGGRQGIAFNGFRYRSIDKRGADGCIYVLMLY
jgi:hypothetical protein